MPWQASFNQSLQCVELVYSQIVTPKELNDAFLEAVQILSDHNSRNVLADCSEMVGGHSMVDLYYLIDLYQSVGLRHDMREAIVLPSLQATASEVKFYEVACLNRGYHVKLFKSRELATQWLSKV